MNNPEIRFTKVFLNESKKLNKKYPSFKNDLKELINSLKSNPNQENNISNNIFKIRLKISSKNKGKSSGARVITYLLTENQIYLVTVYDKSEIVNITKKEILKIITNLN